MAAIKKRGDMYQVQIAKNGVRRSASFKTKAAATAWANETEHKISTKTYLEVPDLSFKDLLEKYSLEVSPSKKTHKKEMQRLKYWKNQSIGNVKLKDLDVTHVSSWRQSRLKINKAASVNRDWNLLSHVCSTATNEWRWLNSNPFSKVKRPKDEPHRQRRITDKEMETIIYCSGYDYVTPPSTIKEQVGAMFLFAIETAMRSGEILNMTWNDIHMDKKFVHIPESKNGSSRQVPLSTEAHRILKQMQELKTPHAFEMSASQRDSNWRKYCKKSGIVDLRFHDTRHEATTRLASKMEVLDLARTTGHKDINMLLVYYNKSAEDIAKKLNGEV